MRSEILQLKLNRGDKVRLLGEEKGGYYKIAPPGGAYLWVSTRYTKAISPSKQVGPKIVITDTNTPIDTNVIVPTDISLETRLLKEYYILQKQIEAERAKPMDQQDYTNIKDALVKITRNRAAGKAVRYSKYSIKQIERFELALAVAKEVQLQDVQLQQIKEQIDKARAARLAAVQDLGRFAVIGHIQDFKRLWL